jgi:hypothetical protein
MHQRRRSIRVRRYRVSRVHRMDKTQEDRRGTFSARGSIPCFLRCHHHRRRGLRPVEECSRIALLTRCVGSRRLARAAGCDKVCWPLHLQHEFCLHSVSRYRESDSHRVVCASVLPTFRHVDYHTDRRDHRVGRSWACAVGQDPQDEGCGMVTPNKSLLRSVCTPPKPSPHCCNPRVRWPGLLSLGS